MEKRKKKDTESEEERKRSTRDREAEERIDESQVHNGLDEGFVYYEE